MSDPPYLTLILGVHRSGTSLLTRGLIAAGAQAGTFADIKDPDNPDGYAEHPSVRHFNNRLLAHLGASWDNWGFLASTVEFNTPALAPWRAEAAEILRKAFTGPGPFVLKDPRCATLAPFWEHVVPMAGFTLRRIVIVRDPVEVAESQRQRVSRRPHEFPVIADPEPMAALWAVTMLEVLAALSDDETLLVSHAALLTDCAGTLAAAAAFAGLDPNPAVLARFAVEGVNAALYRSRANEVVPLPDGVWMTAARKFYADLVSEGTPRLLPKAAARMIAANQSQLSTLLPGLSAARDSIARMLAVQAKDKDKMRALSRLVWQLASLAAVAPKEQLKTAIPSLVALSHEYDIDRFSFAYAHTVARLMLKAGDKAEAMAWLERIRPQFGHLQDFVRLEELVQKAPSGALSGAEPSGKP